MNTAVVRYLYLIVFCVNTLTTTSVNATGDSKADSCSYRLLLQLIHRSRNTGVFHNVNTTASSTAPYYSVSIHFRMKLFLQVDSLSDFHSEGGGRPHGRKNRLKNENIKGEESVGAETCLCCTVFPENLHFYLEHVLNHEDAEISAGFVVCHLHTSMDTNNTKKCVWNNYVFFSYSGN